MIARTLGERMSSQFSPGQPESLAPLSAEANLAKSGRQSCAGGSPNGVILNDEAFSLKSRATRLHSSAVIFSDASRSPLSSKSATW
jgi:hypothetical protein